MFAGKTLFCDCGYEVRADDDDAFVEAIRRHAWQTHGIDFSVEFARDVARRAERLSAGEQNLSQGIGEEKR